MSNMLTKTPHFQLPEGAGNPALLERLKRDDLRLLLWVYEKFNSRSRAELAFSVQDVVGRLCISPRALHAARIALTEAGLLRVQRVAGGHVYGIKMPSADQESSSEAPDAIAGHSRIARRVRIEDLKAAQIEGYFVVRFGEGRVETRDGFYVQCPFHEDTRASGSVSFTLKAFNCFAGCLWNGEKSSGGLIAFEMKFSSCSVGEAIRNIAKLCNEPGLTALSDVEAVYDYRNDSGELVFQVIRSAGKKFSCRKPNGLGGWDSNIRNTARPLYHQQEVLKADFVLLLECEKDVETARELNLATPDGRPIACSTNSHGYLSFKDEQLETLRGKRVVIVPDNDRAGHERARFLQGQLGEQCAILEVSDRGLKDQFIKDFSDWALDGWETREDFRAEVMHWLGNVWGELAEPAPRFIAA